MPNNVDWITKRVQEAQEAHAGVTEAVAIRMTKLLMCELGEKQLRSGELAEIAKALITDMSTSGYSKDQDKS